MIPQSIIEEARRERAIIGYVKTGDHREPIRFGEQIVGFYTPHQNRWGLTYGPIYVSPPYRRMGLALAAYEARRDVTMWDFAADWNNASSGMLTKAGFLQWRRGTKGWFYRRLAS